MTGDGGCRAGRGNELEEATMAMTISRRGLLMSGAGIGAASLIGSPAFAQEKKLRMYFWGSKDRADRTAVANGIYSKKNAGTSIESEFVGWGDYWARMATQAAAKNLADVIQMDYRYIFEYARRGALMPLDQFMGKQLDIADFGANSIDCGKVDGKLYGVNLGNNSTALIYNVSAFDRLGLKPPKIGTKWDEFAQLATEITKANKGAVFGSADLGGGEPQFECWLRQHGKSLYTDDGKVGFTPDDAAGWYDFWDKLRKAGGCVTPDIQAVYKDTIDTDPLTLGKSFMGFAHSNQLVGYQALNKDKVSMTMYPAGDKPGQYLKPSMFFSVAANSKNGADAAKIINTFCKDPEAVVALSVERGVPASAAARLALAPTLDELGKVAVAYISEITDKVGPLPPPPPKGAGEAQAILRKFNEQVGFGKLSAKDAAKAFHTEVTDTLERG
jgi:multiple sugar transport system substrate-binding protein